MLPAFKRFSKATICFTSYCVLLALCLSPLSNVLNAGSRVPVAYDVFFENTPKSNIVDIAAPQFREVFTPLDKTPIPHSVKRTWIRILIPIEQLERWRMNDFFPFLQFGGKVRRPTTLFYKPATNPQRWKSSVISRCHIPLPETVRSGLAEYYLRIDGKPGMWFRPQISLKDTAMPLFVTSLFFWLFIGLTLGIAGLNFFLAVFTKTESCFWLCAYTLLTTAYYTYGFLPSATVGLEFSTAWTILLPGLALIILPHIGRNLFHDAKCPQSIDRQLWSISFLGVLLAITPLIPGLSAALYYLPVWPAFAALGAIPGYAAIKHKLPGGKRFTAGCLLTALGSFIALLPAYSSDATGILQIMPFAGVAMGMMIFTPIALKGSIAHRSVTTNIPTKDITNATQKIIKRISHDLQSPLTTIARMNEKLSDLALPDEGKEALHTIESATHVLQLQLKDLLDLNRVDNNRLTLTKRKFYLQLLLNDTHNILLPHIEEKGLTLAWKVAPETPAQFIGDRNRFMQILLNVIGNAIRFSNSGDIVVSVSQMQHTERTSQLLVTVKDQGRGIPLQNKYDILGRFCQEPEQNTGKYCGSGLGLSVASELVHLMGGFICIESEPNIGTSISFTLRLEEYSRPEQLATEQEGHTTSQPEHSDAKAETIPQLLVLDSRTEQQDSIAALLDSDLFQLHEGNSAEHVLSTYKSLKPDAVIVATELNEDAIDILAQLSTFTEKRKQSLAPTIAIANSPVSAELLCSAGYTEAFSAPATTEELLLALENLGIYTPPSQKETPEPSPSEASVLTPSEKNDDPTDSLNMNKETEADESILSELEQEKDHTIEEEAVAQAKALDQPTESAEASEKEEPEHLEEAGEIADATVVEETTHPVQKTSPDEITDDEDGETDASSEPRQESPAHDDAATELIEEKVDEKQVQAAKRRVTSDNQSALDSITEDHEKGLSNEDLLLTELANDITALQEKLESPATTENENIQPQIPQIASELNEIFDEIHQHLEQGSTAGVLATTKKMQHQAQQYALREVVKVASCVERAAKAENHEAISTLMPELKTTVMATGRVLEDVYKHSSPVLNNE
ncbi:ATP-binding protein [Halodesulfovibrio sp.]|jgi:signal transduction histidine kinase|uniref:ATP-binding protein n=1 Tax=Halodesulfovibrio sp. TaxID=1912772 RepID=UPI0025F27548|nr:ATP-binding protein [Halodesulfovibrio sp.]MCT4536294.1 ATP-binding protein [Halodesulfovibrio sp.]